MKETMLQIITVAARIVVPLLAFAVGLGAGSARATWLWQRRSLLLRSLAAVLLVVPALAVVTAKLLPLDPAVKVGLLCVALSVGPVMAMVKSRSAGAEESYAFALDAYLLLLSVVFVPLAVSVIGALFQRHLSLGALDVAKVVLPLQLLPLAAGALVGRFFPNATRKVIKPFSLAVNVAFGALALVVLVALAKPMLAIGLRQLSAIAAFALCAVAAGHVLGGPDEGTRRVLATFSSMRFPALALAIATLSPLKQQVVPVVIAYLVFTVLVLGLYAAVGKRAATPHAPAAGTR